MGGDDIFFSFDPLAYLHLRRCAEKLMDRLTRSVPFQYYSLQRSPKSTSSGSFCFENHGIDRNQSASLLPVANSQVRGC